MKSSKGWKTIHKKSPDEPFRIAVSPDGRMILSVVLPNGQWLRTEGSITYGVGKYCSRCH